MEGSGGSSCLPARKQREEVGIRRLVGGGGEAGGSSVVSVMGVMTMAVVWDCCELKGEGILGGVVEMVAVDVLDVGVAGIEESELEPVERHSIFEQVQL